MALAVIMRSMTSFIVRVPVREGLVTEPFRYKLLVFQANRQRSRFFVRPGRQLNPRLRRRIRTIVRWSRPAAVLAAAFLLWSAPSALAQLDPLKGMVWTEPEGEARAELDLREMKRYGVDALRTDPIRSEALLRVADTLGLNVFVDLPISRLPAARLVDTLQYARAVLDTAVSLARNHASIRAIGLTRYSDTSDSNACAYVAELARHVRATGPPGIRTYYVTRFIDDDVCSSAVDFVLADVRGAADPAGVLRRWEAAGERPPLGVAELGVWVRGDSLRGLDVRASPERQARYFENHLTTLLSDTLSVRPPAVFVYRWRDVRRVDASTAHDLDDPYMRRYGLHMADGTPRPALRVVAGIFTGRQRVFAFTSGDPPPASTSWPTLVGWTIMAALGIFYALSPRFRHMVPRYFQARFFFREAVREGRDVLLGASTVLLASLGVASGLVMFVVADAIRVTDTFALVLQWLPVSTQGVVATLLARPLVLLTLTGCIYVVVLLAWAVILSILSRRTYAVTPAQVLMLVVWPRWPLLLVMVAAMVAASLPDPNLYLIGGLAAAWVLISLASVARTLIDLVAVARLPLWFLPLAVLLHPALTAVGALTVMILGYIPEVEFAWHAVVRR